MGVLLDTSAVIGWLERRDPGVIDTIEADPNVPAISAVTLGELHRGVRRAPDDRVRTIRRLHLDFVTDRLDIVPIDRDSASAWAMLAERFPRRTGHNDVWIAVAAATTRRQLVTQDEQLATALTDARTSTDPSTALARSVPDVIHCPIGT